MLMLVEYKNCKWIISTCYGSKDFFGGYTEAEAIKAYRQLFNLAGKRFKKVYQA